MLFYLTSRIISSVAAFLYPGYASYKTLSQRPASEEELERWLMYWSVLGCLVSVEYVAEWLVSWIPGYYPAKTIFLLYLALPQTRGASYLYTNHLQPFFHTHESQIDATIASLKVRIYTFLQERLRAIWEQAVMVIRQQQQQQQQQQQGFAGPATNANAGVTGQATPGPTQLVFNFWRSYGPSIIATGTALLRQTTAAAAAATATPNTEPPLFNAPAGAIVATPQPVPARTDTAQSVLERRRQLEAELAALPKVAADTASEEATAPNPAPVPIPVLTSGAGTTYTTSRTSSSSEMRERNGSGGKFEEIEMPSDLEGYENNAGERGSESDSGGSGGWNGSMNKRTSWFGWGGTSAGKGGYERVKSE